jgi:hypothetical protein
MHRDKFTSYTVVTISSPRSYTQLTLPERARKAKFRMRIAIPHRRNVVTGAYAPVKKKTRGGVVG